MDFDKKIEELTHSHDFAIKNQKGERRTKYVLYLTLLTMIVEIVAGTIYGSMALLADGWHMGTHAAAFILTIYAYSYARKHSNNPSFSFGTGKVNVLGGFASAIALIVVAVVMLLESSFRLINPEEIHFNQAIMVAVIGLVINLTCAFLLGDHHHHGHDHHHHGHDHHHDHNLRAAYLHVLADALTSVLAILALCAGKYFGLNGLDPVMGIVGALIITKWSLGLMKQTAPILLDGGVEAKVLEEIKASVESPEDKVTDLHLWRISGNHYAALVSIASKSGNDVSYFKEKIKSVKDISHLTIEINKV